MVPQIPLWEESCPEMCPCKVESNVSGHELKKLDTEIEADKLWKKAARPGFFPKSAASHLVLASLGSFPCPLVLLQEKPLVLLVPLTSPDFRRIGED
ncbi:unnamed protein product [Microthlaspi erraticum]|uniref:Uncharacterized protein n=1 Tax=Microthlaspi erraticum TaxID=1685480 RepID=A0A6D2HNV4_9BRAS|nr:unnamed protein product [Microthlaspi erraticum]